MFHHILVVCAGNICRSPMGVGFFNKALAGKNVTVDSAGIVGLIGHPADDKAIAAMKEIDIDIGNHVAKKLSRDLVMQSDIILVMSQRQVEEVTSAFTVAAGKTYCLGHWLSCDIEDPYQQSQQQFNFARDRIANCVDSWLNKM